MISTYEELQGLAKSGWSLIPIRRDGSKAPAVSWKPYQTRIASEEELRQWAAAGYGIGVVCGRISSNFLCLDFDIPGFYEKWERFCVEAGMGELLKTLPLVQTPDEGRHVYLRCDEAVGGNQKLAMRPGPIDELVQATRPIDTSLPQTAIETRGEGGYVVAPGSPSECHPTNRPYRFLRGDFTSVPRLTAGEIKTLISFARALNEHIEPNRVQDGMKTIAAPQSGRLRSGDDFNQRGDVLALLLKHGWEVVDHE
ncbi:MAG: bifunctional DNA primase/polymerase [Janthinobacterium lividum]